MFDIGWGELIVIGVIALIVIGPKELPTVLRTAGRFVNKMRRMASEFQDQFQEALREAELQEIRKQAEDLSGTLHQSVSDLARVDPLADAQRHIETALTAEPGRHDPAALAEAAQAESLPQPAEPSQPLQSDENAPKVAGGGA
ncbi:MAG: twin-arginine translocase subunit TatB [Pseudolabrys sp.]|nr:twin-arginine translocase subunit TatB [Pseudolabrys sp.]